MIDEMYTTNTIAIIQYNMYTCILQYCMLFPCNLIQRWVTDLTEWIVTIETQCLWYRHTVTAYT